MALAASSLDISTKAKPRGDPVTRSLAKENVCTVPYSANRARTDSSLAEKGKLPTYSLVMGFLEMGGRGPPVEGAGGIACRETACPRASPLMARGAEYG